MSTDDIWNTLQKECINHFFSKNVNQHFTAKNFQQHSSLLSRFLKLPTRQRSCSFIFIIVFPALHSEPFHIRIYSAMPFWSSLSSFSAPMPPASFTGSFFALLAAGCHLVENVCFCMRQSTRAAVLVTSNTRHCSTCIKGVGSRHT